MPATIEAISALVVVTEALQKLGYARGQTGRK
jgi:hypothetical protein